MPTLISCEAHDYFEMVCIRRNQILVTTIKRQTYQGIASDIQIIDNQEMLLIEQGKITHPINLTDIAKLEVINNISETPILLYCHQT